MHAIDWLYGRGFYLGDLWSGWITKKGDHRIVDSGPYGIVRHPIYTLPPPRADAGSVRPEINLTIAAVTRYK